MSQKWSDKTIFEFWDQYEQRECLWNVRDKCFHDRDARINALNAIVKELNIPAFTIDDLRNKIKSLRTMYAKEHGKVEKSKKSRIGTDELYVPRLFWYQRADRFLNGVTTTRNTMTNLVSKPTW